MPWSKQPLDSCPCPPEAPDPGKSMVLVVPCFKVKCGQSQSLATDQLLFMAATVYCESPVSFQPRQYCLEIWNLAYNLHFFLHEEKKNPSNTEMCSYPVLTIPGCHPAALISAFSSACWTCQHLVTASWCVGYHWTLCLTIIHKKTHRILTRKKKCSNR